MRILRLTQVLAATSLATLAIEAGAQQGLVKLERHPAEARIVHQSIDVNVSFDRFSANLEKLLGKYTAAGAETVMQDPALAVTKYKAMEGEQGLMLFSAMAHGNLMNLSGSPRKAKRYNMGNPLIAHQMMSKDFRAGLYAPLSVLIYEMAPGRTRIEYDLPSTIFGQFGNSGVNEVAQSLDAKLEKIFEKAAELSQQ